MNSFSDLVTVVIVGWNHWHTLERCLISVLEQSCTRTEVIYVDNASTDSSVQKVVRQFPMVQVIQNTANLGFTKACNQGIAASTGQYVFILNPDTTLEKNAVFELISACELDERAGILGPKMLMMCDPMKINSVGMAFDRRGRCRHLGDGEADNGQYSSITMVPMVAGAAMFCRKCMLIEIGGFDEDYFAYHEDAELCLRAWCMGWKCLNVPNAIAYHMRNSGVKNSLEFARVARYYEHRNRYWNIIFYSPFSVLAPKLVWIFFDEVRTVMRHLFGWMKSRTMPVELRARLANTANFSSLLKKRRHILKRRKIPRRQLKMLLS